jgi:hypothetical protein
LHRRSASIGALPNATLSERACGVKRQHRLIVQEKEQAMSKLTLGVMVLALLSVGPACWAAETGGGKGQASRMSQCSSEAKEKGLKGDARKEHMSVCLRNPSARAAAKECNQAANEKDLKGERRKEFVKDCVKSKPSATVG